MRVFVAGATGAIGRQLLPILVEAGYDVVGTTRSPNRVAAIQKLGATGVVCDILDADAVVEAVARAKPDVIVNEVTDLPSKAILLPTKLLALNKVRVEGGDNLLAAAKAAGVKRMVTQSIAFKVPGIAQKAVDHLEAGVLAAKGVVLRYGSFYGPGTWSETAPKSGPALHVEAAARVTMDMLTAKTGTYVVVDGGAPRKV